MDELLKTINLRYMKSPIHDIQVLDRLMELNGLYFIFIISKRLPIRQYSLLDPNEVINNYYFPDNCNLLIDIKYKNYQLSTKIMTYERKSSKNTDAIQTSR